MVGDSIANLITTLKNASTAGKSQISFPESNLSASILEVLEKNGFVGEVKRIPAEPRGQITAEILYTEGKPKISGGKRVSKQSCRRYSAAKDLRKVKNGSGILVVSTPKGVMTGEDAKSQGVGGEVLFELW